MKLKSKYFQEGRQKNAEGASGLKAVSAVPVKPNQPYEAWRNVKSAPVAAPTNTKIGALREQEYGGGDAGRKAAAPASNYLRGAAETMVQNSYAAAKSAPPRSGIKMGSPQLNGQQGTVFGPAQRTVRIGGKNVPVSSSYVPNTTLSAGKNAEQLRQEDYNRQTPLSVLGHNTAAGLAGIQHAAYATLDFLLPDVITPKPVQDYINKAKSNSEDIASKVRTYNYERGGNVGGVVGDLYQSAIQMLPQAVAALLTGGMSETAQASAQIGQSGMGLLARVGQNLAKNPMYWSSFLQTVGTEYEDAKANGASDLQAAISAITSSAANAVIEIGGGFETMDDSITGLKALAKTAWEEGTEEFKQGVTSALTQKALFDHDRPYYSVEDDNAVINPKRAAMEFGGGALLGGAVTGGKMALDWALGPHPRTAPAMQDVTGGATEDTTSSPLVAAAQDMIKVQGVNTAVQATGETLGVDTEAPRVTADAPATAETDTADVQRQPAAVVDEAVPAEPRAVSGTRTESEPATRPAIETVPGSTMGKNGALAIVEHAPKSGDTARYAAAFHTYYEAGLAAQGLDTVRSVYDGALTDAQKKAAYYAGGKDYLESLETEKQAAPQATVYGEMESGVIENEYAAAVDTTERAAIDYLAKSLGVKVELVPTVAEGRANGSIRDGVMQIALDAADAENPVSVIAMHEFTHRLQQLAPAEYRGFRDYAVQQMLASEFAGETAQTLAERYVERHGGSLTTEQAFDEIAADYSQRLLTDRAAAEGFIRDDRSRAQKFFDTLKSLIKDLTAYIEGLAGKAKVYADERLGDLKKGYEMWRDAFKAADQEVKTRRADGEAVQNAGENGTTETQAAPTRYSLNPDLGRQVDAWLEETKPYQRMTSHGYFQIGTTSDALKSIGVRDGKIYFRKQKIGYIMDSHPEVTSDVIKMVPDILETPVLIMKSKTREDSIVLFGDVKGANGQSIMAALELTPKSGGGLDAAFSLVTSAYGRSGKSIQNLIRNSEILYLDPNKKRTDTWLMQLRVQFPSGQPSYGSQRTDTRVYGSMGSITYADGKVKIQGVPGTKIFGEDVRFSRGGSLERTVETQRQTIERLREQFHKTKNPVVDRKAAAQIASEVTEEYSSKYGKAELAEELRALSETVLENRDKDGGFATAKAEAVGLAHKILAQSEVLNDTAYREYEGLRKHVRETGIALNETDRADLAAAGGFDAFRKANFGRLKLTDSGMPVDTLYRELHESYGDGLFPADITHPADQLIQIAEVLQSVQATYENPYSGNLREAADMLADELIDSLTAAPRQVTYADKQAAKLDDVRAEYRQKARDAVARERAKREDRIAEVKEYYQKRVRDVRTIRDNRELRGKIQKHVRKLSDLLVKPTDAKHVPEGLRKPVAEFLSAIDLTSSRVAAEPSQRTRKLQALKDAYERIGREESGDYALVDPDLADNMQEILDLKGKSVSDFSKGQLETLYKVVMAVESTVRNANRMFSEGRYKTISDLGEAFIGENGYRKPFAEKYGLRPVDNLLNMDSLRPFDFFHEFGESGEAMYGMLRRAMDKKIVRTKQLQDFAAGLTDGVDIKKWSGKDAPLQTFHTAGGDLSLTPAQVMSLYKLLSREQAKDHIFRGGILQGNTVAKQGKHGHVISKSYDPVHVTLEDVQQIVSTLTDEQKRVADQIGEFMSTTLSDWGNEVSMELYGYRKFDEAHYFPIQSSENSVKTELAQGKDSRVKNMGFTKATVKKANNAIVLDDIFDVFVQHADDMGTYNAFAPTLEDVQRVYNYRRFQTVEEGDGTKSRQENGTVKSAIGRTVGDRGNKYFRQLMKDLNEGIRSTTGSEIAEKMLSRYKRAAVGLNARVVLQQPTAIARAAAFIDPKYIAQGLATRGDFDKVKAYAPIAQWKDWGYFQFDTGRQMKDIILDNKALSEWAMAGAGLADNVTWAHLWNAVEAETKDKTKLEPGSDAFYKACSERFSYLIDRTQVVDSVLHRSQIMRSGNTLLKMATSFMAEPTMTYNLLRTSYRDALIQGGSAARKQAGYSTLAFLASATLTALAAGLSDAVRDDDDDETLWQKYLQAVTGLEGDEESIGDYALGLLSGNLGDNLNPLNMIPFAKDIMSMLQGYEVKRMDMSAISDTKRAADNLIKAMNGTGKNTGGYALMDFLLKAGKLAGFSAYNGKREIEGIVNTFVDGLGRHGVDVAGWRFQMDKVKFAIGTNKSMYIEQMYRAEVSGDTELSDTIHAELIENGVSEDEINKALKKMIREVAAEGLPNEPDEGTADDSAPMLDTLRDAGLTVNHAIEAVHVTAALKSLKNAEGKTVSNSLGLQKMQAINKISGLNEEQRKVLYAYVGVGKSIIDLSPQEVNAKLADMKRKAK